MSIYCPQCGAENKDTARFCRGCGRTLSAASGPNPPPVAAAGTPAYGSSRQSPPTPAGPAAWSGVGRTGLLAPNFIVNNRYLITRKVGHGGMAAVYDAVDNHTSRRVALKEMSDSAITNPADRMTALAQFRQEAQLLATLDHPNLPKVSDVFEYDGKQYLAMDFVDGHTLEDILQTRKVLPEAEVLPWIWQLCDVLEYLHNQNIIFRDLKPSNIMIDHTRQVKLIDFGIVRFFKPGKAHDTIPMGTQGYAAPELMQGRQSTVCSDIYSFGVTLYQLLTGIDPTGLPYGLPPIRQYCPQVSVAVERVITRAVNTDPDKRWQRMAEIRAALGGNAPKAPVGATPYTAPGVGTPGYEAPRRVSRPTTRLVMAAARLSNKQLLAIGAGALFGAALALWFGTPILSQYPVIWNNIPLVAIVAPLVYAAVRRPWIASVAYGALALLGAVITGARRVSDSPTDWRLPQTLVALVLAIILIEVFVRLLPKVRGKNRDEAWQRELAWLCLMAVVTSILMVGLVWGWGFGLNPIMWLGAAGMGALGWFVGDTIQQYLFLKQTGIQRGRGGY